MTGQSDGTLTRGQSVVVDMTTSVPALVRANKPVQVLQYAKSPTSSGDTSAPASLLVLPTSLFADSFLFSVPVLTTGSYSAMVIIESSKRGEMMLGLTPLNGLQWVAVPDSSPALSAAAVTLTAGRNLLQHQFPGNVFAAYVYGVSPGDCAYAFPVGMALSPAEEVRVGHVTCLTCMQCAFECVLYVLLYKIIEHPSRGMVDRRVKHAVIAVVSQCDKRFLTTT